MPRLTWVTAHSSGTRSPVLSFRASRKATTASSSFAVPLSRSPQAHKCSAQTVLGVGPGERNALAGLYLERLTIDGDGLFEPLFSALVLPNAKEHPSQAALGRGPVKRHTLAR